DGDIAVRGGRIQGDNGAYLLGRKSAGVSELFLSPRETDNATHLFYGQGGFYIRNHANNYIMYLSGGDGPFGNVGINRATPGAALHAYSDDSFATAIMDSDSQAGTWLALRNNSSSRSWQLIATGSGNGEGPGKLLFMTGTAPNSVDQNVMT